MGKRTSSETSKFRLQAGTSAVELARTRGRPRDMELAATRLRLYPDCGQRHIKDTTFAEQKGGETP